MTLETVVCQKWHKTNRNLKRGDILLVHDKSLLNAQYLMATMESVNQGRDGLVRSCTVGYRIHKWKDMLGHYLGGRWKNLTCSIKRLTLLLPV